MSNELIIKSATLQDDNSSLRLTVVVHNPSDRTLHVYSTIRGLRYDAATKTLEVQLSDHGLRELRDLRGPPNPATFIMPDLCEVAAHADCELSFRLARTLSRVDPTRSIDTLKFETLGIHEAHNVSVDVAWGVAPFYSDPREPQLTRKQLVDWSSGVAKHRSQRKPSPNPGDRNQRGTKK